MTESSRVPEVPEAEMSELSLVPRIPKRRSTIEVRPNISEAPHVTPLEPQSPVLGANYL